jgi:predicted nucleic acid-binding protein
VSGRILVDTSVYVAALRDESFAAGFRPRYERSIPRVHLSSVVVQELLAGARTASSRRLASALIEPFERARRVVTPTHGIWRDAGLVLAQLWRDAAAYRAAIHLGLVNDVLIALTARAIGACVLTRNRRHFEMIGAVREFDFDLL